MLLVVFVFVWVLGLEACSKNPGTLSQSEVEEKLAEVLELKELSLTENPAGGYKGKGMTAAGVEYDLTVAQDEDEKMLRYKAESESAPPLQGFVKHYRNATGNDPLLRAPESHE